MAYKANYSTSNDDTVAKKAKEASHKNVKAKNSDKTTVKNVTSKRAAPRPASEYTNIAETIGVRDAAKWERVQAQLKAQLGMDVYSSWFGRCRLEAISKSQLLLSVPTVFLKSWIRSHYSEILLELWQKQLKSILRIDVVVRSAVRTANVQQDEPETRKQPFATNMPRNKVNGASPIGFGQSANIYANQTQNNPVNNPANNPANNQWGRKERGKSHLPFEGKTSGVFRGSPLDPGYTFSTLIEGESNRMAYAAAQSVAEADGAVPRFNPLFIHASVGLGKTHLLQAIAWAAAARREDMKILYLTAEYFMWRFASAIRDQSALSLKESWRDIDLLLIDDMQFLQGKSIQQEFCHLLNALIDNAKQVVVAADRQPAELESLDTRVKSRLKGGVALEVKAPELKMRRKMLEMRYREAQHEETQLDICPDVLDYVAAKVASSGRDLEGAFNQLIIQHRFCEGPVEMEAIEKMLGHLVQSSEQKRVRIEDIQKIVARHFNVSKNDLLSNRRTRVIVHPRQISMYLAKHLTPRSLPEIGRRFGGRDHTTVLHAVRKIEGLLSQDPKMNREIELLKRLIYDEQGL